MCMRHCIGSIIIYEKMKKKSVQIWSGHTYKRTINFNINVSYDEHTDFFFQILLLLLNETNWINYVQSWVRERERKEAEHTEEEKKRQQQKRRTVRVDRLRLGFIHSGLLEKLSFSASKNCIFGKFLLPSFAQVLTTILKKRIISIFCLISKQLFQ